jgi:RND family efflux transporter MFP subunit
MRASLGALAALGIVALMAISFAAGLVAGTPTPTPTPLGPRPTATPTATPTPTPTARPSPSPRVTPEPGIVASAIVVPQRSADIVSPLTTIVERVFVVEGAEVRAGQLLMRLDSSARRAAVNLADAELRRARAMAERARIALEQLPDDAPADQRAALEADLALAEAEVAVAESSLEAAREALRQTEIRAPFDGTLTSLAVGSAEQAIAGRTLAVVADISGWLLETTNITELDVVQIAVGDRAFIELPALPDLRLEGTVQQIRARGSGGQIAFDVVIRPFEHPAELRWSMSARVRILPGS